ncbi:TIR domain-containing protein [Burkholderia sp. WP9]|uniref:toll/interleukin-1 receptor domain-containing protein n=1 Tax=Burkholderia sp. WP9 TaxID=1500263 RepID=UPI000894E4BE|nr:toll/interleukin-1 receptor domain-containing protein [Burkholderia sp. WP9]SED47094.1 TIR domain-containing protein [Burkholderia sp. WP9]
MPRIFISYRRGYSNGEVGRLFQDLSTEFGRRNVFMDVATVQHGTNFRSSIDQTIACCDILLAVIGRDWATATDNEGRRRLDGADDYVRFEIALALRGKVTVIPVLVHGAAPPSDTTLPSDLKELGVLQAVELSHTKWESDVQYLIKRLRTREPSKIWGRPTLLAVGVALTILVFGFFAAELIIEEINIRREIAIPLLADFPEEFGHIIARQSQSICDLTGIHRNDGDGSYKPVSARERFLLYARCEATGEMFPTIPRGGHSCCEHLSQSDARALRVCSDAQWSNNLAYIRKTIRCPR